MQKVAHQVHALAYDQPYVRITILVTQRPEKVMCHSAVEVPAICRCRLDVTQACAGGSKRDRWDLARGHAAASADDTGGHEEMRGKTNCIR